MSSPICTGCASSDNEVSNPIIACRICGTKVHKNCYQVSGNSSIHCWICDACEYFSLVSEKVLKMAQFGININASEILQYPKCVICENTMVNAKMESNCMMNGLALKRCNKSNNQSQDFATHIKPQFYHIFCAQMYHTNITDSNQNAIVSNFNDNKVLFFFVFFFGLGVFFAHFFVSMFMNRFLIIRFVFIDYFLNISAKKKTKRINKTYYQLSGFLLVKKTKLCYR